MPAAYEANASCTSRHRNGSKWVCYRVLRCNAASTPCSGLVEHQIVFPSLKADFGRSVAPREATPHFNAMRCRLGALLLTLLVAAGAMAAESAPESLAPQQLEHIVQLLELNGTLPAARQTAEQVVSQLRTTNPSIPAEVWTRYTALATDRQTLIDLYAPIYGRYLNDENVLGIVAFYTSPLGSRWREALPQIAVETRQDAQQFVAGVALSVGDEGNAASTDEHSAGSNQAPDPRTQDVVRLLRASGALSQARAAMTDTLERIRNQGLAPGLPDTFWQSARNKLTDENALLRLWTPAYLNHLSATDVVALIAFYESPVGKRFVNAQAAIQQESVAAAAWLSNRSARQAVREVLGPLPAWRLQNPKKTGTP